MIVSAQIDTMKPLAKKARVVKAVRQIASTEQPPQFALPPQKPFVNLFAKIRKCVNDNTNISAAIGKVPLKSMQVGSHAAGASLFNAPVATAMVPLKVPIYSVPIFEGDMTEEVDMPFTNYKHGKSLRPSMRELIPSKISEPVGMTYRSDKVRTTTNRDVDVGFYDVGMDVLEMEIKGR
jgi:hypothetical protein